MLSQKRNDTLAVKLAGGPTLSVYVDIVKNQDALLDMEGLDFYQFNMEEPVQLDNRLQYVISFRPKVILPYALYYGKLYVDYENCHLPVPNSVSVWIIRRRLFRLY